MDKLEIVKFLIKEIEYERSLFVKAGECDQENERRREEAKDSNGYYHNYVRLEGRSPSKNRIKDNCKKIRQLMQDVSIEANKEGETADGM